MSESKKTKVAWRFIFDDLKEEKKTYNTRLKKFVKDMDIITKKHKIFPRPEFFYVSNKEQQEKIENIKNYEDKK